MSCAIIHINSRPDLFKVALSSPSLPLGVLTSIARYAGSDEFLSTGSRAHAPGFMLPSAPRTAAPSLAASRAFTSGYPFVMIAKADGIADAAVGHDHMIPQDAFLSRSLAAAISGSSCADERGFQAYVLTFESDRADFHFLP